MGTIYYVANFVMQGKNEGKVSGVNIDGDYWVQIL